MLKRISAALLAVSVLAAPALAATSGKTNEAPLTKSAPVKTSGKTDAKIDAKTDAKAGIKSSVLNANAKMGGHHKSHHSHVRHHSHHKKMGAIKTHTKVGFKQAKPATKRG
jgi:hypothetical protein